MATLVCEDEFLALVLETCVKYDSLRIAERGHMKSITITATEAARSLSEVLNQVRYQGRRFDVRRGKEVVAQIVPPRPTKGVPIAELNQIFAKLPKLGKDEAEQFAKDLKEIRRVAKPPRDEWV